MKFTAILLLGGLTTLACSSATLAADLTMTPAPMVSVATPWTGPYLGADLGYMFGSTSVVDTGVVTETGAATDGWLVGVLGGYNWQVNDLWVLGLEGDLSAGSIHGNGRNPLPSTPNSYDLNWMADIRGRVGFLVDPSTLLFGAAGVGFTDIRFTEGGSSSSSSSDVGVVRTGWTVGIGAEHQFTDSLTGRIEVMHSDFGSVTYGNSSDNYVIGFTANIVRAALIWKF